ncbi:hypothetical protein Tco_1445172, partial [Tanacetum coccineum]
LIKSPHVATVVPMSVAGSRFPEGVLMKNQDAAVSRDIQLICTEFSSIQVKLQADWMLLQSSYFNPQVPTGRVVVPTGRYVVPAGKVIIIVSTGRLSLVPTGRVLSPDCDFHEKRMAKKAELNRNSTLREIRPIWNNVHRINKQNKFVPTAVLTRTGKIPVNTAKVNAVSAIGGKGKLMLSPQQVVIGDHKDTTGIMSPNTMVDPVLEIDYPHRALKNKGIVDSGCSRHMTGNKAYLAEFQDFNGGPVTFGGSKGYITGKGKIKTGKLDFEDVCFVKELQHFNLFSVS